MEIVKSSWAIFTIPMVVLFFLIFLCEFVNTFVGDEEDADDDPVGILFFGGGSTVILVIITVVEVGCAYFFPAWRVTRLSVFVIFLLAYVVLLLILLELEEYIIKALSVLKDLFSLHGSAKKTR